jgi:hypothetical protein
MKNSTYVWNDNHSIKLCRDELTKPIFLGTELYAGICRMRGEVRSVVSLASYIDTKLKKKPATRNNLTWPRRF